MDTTANAIGTDDSAISIGNGSGATAFLSQGPSRSDLPLFRWRRNQ